MIVPLQVIIEEVAADAFTLRRIHDSTEQEIKNYIHWDPESVTHTNKMYDGKGRQNLFLEELHISALIRVATIRQNVIRIRNIATASNAYFAVVYANNAPSSMTLSVDGTETSLAFSTYTTISSLITAIGAVSNWEAESLDSNYDTYPTTNLIEEYNRYCGAWGGKEASWENVQMADEPVTGVRLYRDEGRLFRNAGFRDGYQNVAVSYVSGWALASMPTDLQNAVVMLTKYFHTRDSQDATGIKSYSLGHLTVAYQAGGKDASSIPIDVLDILDSQYKMPVIR